jgi:hypothetical protein
MLECPGLPYVTGGETELVGCHRLHVAISYFGREPLQVNTLRLATVAAAFYAG